MTFKRIFLAITAVLPFASSLSVFAEDPTNVQQEATTILKKKKEVNDRPQIPSRNHIICTYENGGLVFDANFEYEYMEVEVSGSESFSDILTPTQPFIEVSLLSGIYTIRCTTDGGTVYEGTITL